MIFEYSSFRIHSLTFVYIRKKKGYERGINQTEKGAYPYYAFDRYKNQEFETKG